MDAVLENETIYSPLSYFEKPTTRKKLILPPKVGNPLRLYDYLCTKRGIDASIVQSLIQKEMLYEDKRGNVVFVGYDEQGTAQFASLRGTHGDFRGDCAGSNKQYSFCMKADVPSDHLYIFESPIDCMSHASLAITTTGDAEVWKQCHRLSLAGTSNTALPFFLKQRPAVKQLVFCLDNDDAGHKATSILKHIYTDKEYSVRTELPKGKDFNDDLLLYKKQFPSEKRMRTRKESDVIG